MYLLNKSLQFLPTMLHYLYCRISECYANIYRPGGFWQTTHSLTGNAKRLDILSVNSYGKKEKKKKKEKKRKEKKRKEKRVSE